MNDTGPPTHLHALDEFSDWAAAAPAAGLWRRSADFVFGAGVLLAGNDE